jgi:hypothetical protein
MNAVEINGKLYLVPQFSPLELSNINNKSYVDDVAGRDKLLSMIDVVSEALSPTFPELTADYLLQHLSLPTAASICTAIREQVRRAKAEGLVVPWYSVGRA